MSAPATVRVFVVDDHDLIRRGLRAIIEEEADLAMVGEASTAREALSRIAAAGPDVAVLDFRLPDGDGVGLCREIRSRHPDVRCVIFTQFADEGAVSNAILAGASGYVLKQSSGTDLVDAIRRVALGQSLLDPVVTGAVLERLRGGAAKGTATSRLTAQERRILALVTEGLTNREIAHRLHLTEKTVKNYVSKLLAKLGVTSRTQAALYAVRQREWPSSSL